MKKYSLDQVVKSSGEEAEKRLRHRELNPEPKVVKIPQRRRREDRRAA